MKTRIAVIFGGCSDEHWVSLQSATAVIRHMNPDKYELSLLGITRQGEWLCYDGPVEDIADDTWFAHQSCIPALISPSRDTRGIHLLHKDHTEVREIGLVFPVLHGKNGEDGTLQGLLDMAGIPFVGCGALSSAVCMDKDYSHTLAQSAGIRSPSFVVVHRHEVLMDKMEHINALGYPLIVKPARGGSSIGISMPTSPADVEEAVRLALEHDNKVVLEEYIQGFEVGCSVLGNDKLTIGEVDEIELKRLFFDNVEKYTQTNSVIHMPARLDTATKGRIRATAATLYRTLGCRGFARVDMFYTPQGDIFFNEINTIPGLTSLSRFPRMLAGIGISFEHMLDTVIGLALCDAKIRV